MKSRKIFIFDIIGNIVGDSPPKEATEYVKKLIRDNSQRPISMGTCYVPVENGKEKREKRIMINLDFVKRRGSWYYPDIQRNSDLINE